MNNEFKKYDRFAVLIDANSEGNLTTTDMVLLIIIRTLNVGVL